MKKPKCQLTGEDGNVFNLMAIVSKTLKRAGQPEKASEMRSKVMESGGYNEALIIFGEYVEVF